MIIYFVETERAEEEFFASKLEEHDLRFVEGLGDVADDAEIVSGFIYSRIDADFLAAHPRLRLISSRSQALDHIDLGTCATSGIRVANVPNYGDNTVAEHTFALILATSRRLRQVMQKPANGRFSYEQTRGFDLCGKTLGIIGMGRIGRRVAALASAFQMRVLATDVREPAALATELNFKFVSLDELFAQSHIISLHTALTPETYHLIDGETLAKCRRGVVLINTARGGLIDTGALREALDSGQVGGAGLDVLEDERVLRESAARIIAGDIVDHLRSDALASEARDADRLREVQELMLGDAVLSRGNVVFTPHIAFNTAEAAARLREITLKNIQSFVGGAPTNLAV